MSDETTLLPCPFCGGEAELVESDYGMFMTGYAVYCKHCCTKAGVTGRLGEAYEWTPIYNNEAEAIAAWNRRTAVTDEQFARATHDGHLWGKCSECYERKGFYLDAETIHNQQEHIAQLEQAVAYWQRMYEEQIGVRR